MGLWAALALAGAIFYLNATEHIERFRVVHHTMYANCGSVCLTLATAIFIASLFSKE